MLLLGLIASEKHAAEALRGLLDRTKLPVVCTYQGAGVVSREHFDCFGGWVGLFHNQPADKLLDAADMVIAVGFDTIEYEPSLWNQNKKRNLVHIDVVPVDIDKNYRPQLELTGNIASTIQGLETQLERQIAPAADKAILEDIVRDRTMFAERARLIERYPDPSYASCTRASDIAERRHDTLFGYGVLSYLAGSTSIQFSSQADIDDRWSTDTRCCFAMGHCGLPGSSQ